MGKIAVITNDLQGDVVYLTPERTAVMTDAQPHYIAFLDEMRRRGHTVYHLQLINLPDDPNANRRADGTLPLQRETEGAAILPAFLGEGDVVVEKNKDSGFYETKLHDLLQAEGVETVVVTGLQTQICVQTTAADAFFRGYNVWVPAECVVSDKTADRDRSLAWLAGYCATVASSKEILETLDIKGELPRMVVKTLP
ncbi:cysteine hydrolase [Amycolatopsis sp. BJA-103]|uniref:cysteine hydrolase n=1 Tax=unclassified Amycolatopsis TaxID=2618356 RepID=UPI000C78381E|nr:cysteine hydrolase [Amycolatopsis sp. BJA-103]AUI57345.1 isochorismatase [Amycolatopsis sp. BJA-103]PNE13154.1 isochorismatase [Amycolatopsis sp. BJA-103]